MQRQTYLEEQETRLDESRTHGERGRETLDGGGGRRSGPSGRRALIWIGFVLAILAAVGLMRRVGGRRTEVSAADRPGSASQAQTALLVTAEKPRQGAVQEAIEVTGTIRARQQVTLTPKISERVARILVDEGDRVAAGQLLVLLDDTTLRAQVAQAEAGVASARARLGQTIAGKGVQDTAAVTRLQQARQDLVAAQARLRQVRTRETLTSVESDTSVIQARNDLDTARSAQAQAEAQVVSARAQVENARARFARREELVRQGAISREDRDEAQRALEVAAAAQTAAEKALEAAQTRVAQAQTALDWAKTNVQRKAISHEDVQAAEAQMAQAQAAVRAAKANLAQTIVTAEDVKAARAAVLQAEANVRILREQWRNTRMTAPTQSVVTRRMVNLGQSVTPQTSLLELVALDALYLEAQVSEREVSVLRPGLPVSVTVDSLPGRTFGAKISEVIPLAQAGSRTFRARIRLPQNRDLKPGSFARGSVVVRQNPRAILIPKTAVLNRDGRSFVYVVEGGKARPRPVQPGVATPDSIEIRHGLTLADQVVTRGGGLTDGAPVEVAGS